MIPTFHWRSRKENISSSWKLNSTPHRGLLLRFVREAGSVFLKKLSIIDKKDHGILISQNVEWIFNFRQGRMEGREEGKKCTFDNELSCFSRILKDFFSCSFGRKRCLWWHNNLGEAQRRKESLLALSAKCNWHTRQWRLARVIGKIFDIRKVCCVVPSSAHRSSLLQKSAIRLASKTFSSLPFFHLGTV